MHVDLERKVWVLNQSGNMERGEGVINGTITLVDHDAVPINFGGSGATAWNDITGVPAALTAAQAAGTASIRAIGTSATTAAAGNHTHSAATTSAAGFMAAADKAKLDGLPTGANTLSKVGIPATNAAPGVAGQFALNETYMYLCVSANSWVRASLVAWT